MTIAFDSKFIRLEIHEKSLTKKLPVLSMISLRLMSYALPGIVLTITPQAAATIGFIK
jgi:hypothetical protein